MIKNLVNHLKILTLSNNETSIINTSQDNNASWITCNESFSNNYKKLYLNFRLCDKELCTLPLENMGDQKNYKCYENFLIYLDSLEPKTILEQIQIMIGCFEEFSLKPQLLLQKLNKTLFNNCINGLLVRWGNCQNYIAEIDIERTCSGKVHMVLKLNKEKKTQPIEIIRVLIIEMSIFFLNKNFENELNENEVYHTFDKLQNYMNIILIKLTNLCQLNLMKPYGIERIIIYRFEIRIDESDINCEELLSMINTQDSKITNNFLVELYYFLPYVKKNIDLNNNVFNAFSTDQDSEDFEIEKRFSCRSTNCNLDVDSKRLGVFLKSLLKQVEIDFISNQELSDQDDFPIITMNENENSKDNEEYFELFECYSKQNEALYGKITTTDITRIEVLTPDYHLLHTPPGTSRSFETSTKNRSNYDRRVKNLHRKSILETLSKKSLTDTTLNDGLHNWDTWIKKLEENKHSEVIPFSFESNEESNISSFDSSNSNNASNSKIVKSRNSLLTLMNLLLKNRVLNPVQLRDDLCAHLRETTSLILEKKINSLFEWLNESLFFSLLNGVTVEWSYRLKSTAASTILEREPSPPHIIIRLSWNLLTRLQIIEIAKMLLHEMIHAFLGLAIGDFCENHDSSYANILKKINHILKLNIPIEHEYAETMELAYVWKCNKCLEKRIRFYNVAPTELQKEQHGKKCDGKFLKTMTPKIFKN